MPEDLQKKFDYGTKNEVNGVATLISTVVPAYLPACFAYYEVGPSFVGTETHPKLREVSGNGILQCSYGNEHCPNYSVHKDRKIVVEIKSPFPQENIAETLFYEIPNRYIPQIQAETRAYNCTELWLICSTTISATVISAQFDQKIWTTLWNLTCELYDKQKPNIPTKLHPAIKELKLAISE